MKKTKNRFALLATLFIAVVLLSVGQHAYKNNGLSSGNVLQSVMNILTARNNGDIVLFVEEGLLKDLKVELKNYSTNVKKELGLNTVIKPVSPAETVLTLKKYATDYHKTGKLEGILIVGNVPTANFYHSEVPTGTIFDSEGYALGDSIYQDVFNKCAYSSSKNAFDYKNVECQQGITIPTHWVARLTPNSTASSSVSLLKDYFKRNHEFRTGKISFENNLLAYLPIMSDFPDPEHDVSQFNKGVAKYGTYSDGRYKLISHELQDSDQQYLAEVMRPLRYESIVFNGHGLPTFHQKNIRSSEIISSSFVYANFLSCSTGRFTTPDYIAGKYLFGGGLVTLASSVPVWAFGDFESDTHEILSKGVPFYKVFEINGLGTATNILGDPTLKMRYKTKNSNTGQKIRVSSQEDIVLSENAPEQSFTIHNPGTKPLYFKIRHKFYQQKESSLLDSFSFGVDANVGYEEGKPDILAPGKSAVITINSVDFFPYDTLSEGTYAGKFYIMSNDASNPLIEIETRFSVGNTGVQR